jgi:hypothetical protein
VAGVTEHALDPRPTLALAHERELPRLAVAAPVEREGRAGYEVGLADEVLPSRSELDD